MLSAHLLWKNHIPVFLSLATGHVDVISNKRHIPPPPPPVCFDPSLIVTTIYIHTTNFGENVGDIINYEWRYKK